MRRKGVVRATDFVGDGASSKTVGLCAHQKLEDREPRWLTQGCERGGRVRRRHLVAPRGRADVPDNG